eukprot:scaffold21360_cov65-Phaeocystis_antarctica.AAC.9
MKPPHSTLLRLFSGSVWLLRKRFGSARNRKGGKMHAHRGPDGPGRDAGQVRKRNASGRMRIERLKP